jgi:tetratricopeptide (TPR) repeat protein
MRLMHKVACLTVMLGTSLALAIEPASDDLQRAARFTNRGTKALATGNLKKARDSYRKALNLVPRFPDAHAGLGHVAMRGKLFDEALAAYEQARDGYREMGGALLELRLGRYNRARQELADLEVYLGHLQNKVDNPGGGRATAELRGELLRVQREIQRLSAIQPPDVDETQGAPGEIFFHLGNAMMNLDRLDDAVAAWETCARMTPDFALVQHNLAVGYWMRGQHREAWLHLERAEELGFVGNPGFRAELERDSGRRNVRIASGE